MAGNESPGNGELSFAAARQNALYGKSSTLQNNALRLVAVIKS